MKKILFALIAFLSVTQSFAAAELLLHWRFDQPHTVGNIEPDTSGKNNDARSAWARIRGGGGMVWKPGEGLFGGAGAVPKDVRGNLISKEPMTLPEEWTLAFWIKPETNQERVDRIITFCDGEKDLVSLGMHNDFSVKLPGKSVKVARKTLQAGKWSHVAVVCAKDSLSIYLDGEKAESKGKTNWDPKQKFLIHAFGRLGTPHHRYEGLLDEVRIYDTPLDEQTLVGLANPKSAFYANEKLRMLPDPGVGYSAWLEKGKAQFSMQGREATPGKNGGKTSCVWKIIEQPSGATGKFADTTKLDTTFTTNKPGAYKLQLTATNDAGSISRTVNAVVFVKDQAPSKTPFYRKPLDESLKIALFEPPRPERAAALQGKKLPVVAHWTFDEKEKNLTSEGKFGSARLFDKPETLELGTFPELTEECSLSFWVYSDRDDNRGSLINVLGDDDKEYWSLKNRTNGSGIPPGYSQLVYKWYQVVSPVKLSKQWNHIVVTFSKEHDNTCKLYVNGNLVGFEKRPLNEATGKPRLFFNRGRDFLGKLDDVILYSTTLNNEEVGALFESTQAASSLVQRIPDDPYKSRAYRNAFVAKNFPELTPTYCPKGFEAERFGGSQTPSPYEHPRLFYSLTDLPHLRKISRTSKAGHRTYSLISQYTDTMFRPTLEETGEYPTAFSLLTDEEAATKKYNVGDQKKAGVPFFDYEGARAAGLVIAAYRALLEADSKTARKLIDSVMRMATDQQKVLDVAREKTSGWQHIYHQVMLRQATPMLYDILYNWMTPEERQKVRRVIAESTAGHWSLGMYGIPALDAHRSNWEPWITGELLLGYLAIYEEEGYDPVGVRESTRALQLSSLLTCDEVSGAPFEGMGKHNLGIGNLAMLSRVQPMGKKVIGSTGIYNHLRKFIFHATVPWGEGVMHDDRLGGLAKISPAAITVLHYARPNDPFLNYLKHCNDVSKRTYASLYVTSFTQECWTSVMSYVEDWKGPTDLGEHLALVAKETKEPLGYFSNYRGLMISRSDWTPEALQLYFQPRSVRGGHSMPTRGYFRINALGRVWVPFNGWYTDNSRFHSVVTVDGIGQDDTCGKVLAYQGAAEQADATFDTMLGDMTNAYRQIDDHWPTFNITRLRPDTQRPWMNMDKRYEVQWYFADRPLKSLSLPREGVKPKEDFEYAYRGAALARGSHPYALIADAIKKDDQSRDYRWNMPLPVDILKAKSYQLSGDTAVLTCPDDPTKHLWVKVFSQNGSGKFAIEEAAPLKGMKQGIPTLVFRSKSVAPAFRVLIYPYRDGDPLPKISGTDAKFSITIGKQQDDLKVGSKGALTLRRISEGK